MEFYRNLYVSDNLKKKKDKIIKKLGAGQYPMTVYLLVLIEEGENQMEFYSSALLRQKLISDDRIYVVGIASGYDDALYLTEEIVREVYEKTGTADIRAFIRAQNTVET